MQSRKNFRFLVKAGVLVSFVVVTSMALFYAFGYRYDVESSQVVETGIVRLSSRLSGVEVSFNGELISNYLPADISRVNPGAYEVRVKKEGYNDWSQKIQVVPGQITEVPPVLMVPKKIEDNIFLINSLPDKDAEVFGGGNFFGYYRKEKGIVSFFELDDKRGVNARYFDLGFTENLGVYSLNSGRLLVQFGNNVLAYFSRVNPEINEEFVLPVGLANLRIVDYGGYYLRNRMMFRFVLPVPFSPNDRKQIVGERVLYDIDNFEVIDARGGYFVVGNQNGKIFGRFDGDVFKPLDSGLSFASEPDLDGNQILYMKGREMWVFDMGTMEKKFVTRFSGEVSDLKWHPDGHHFFFVEDDKLKICSIDMQNCFWLSWIELGSKVVFLEDGNYLVFKKEQSLYGLDLDF